MVSILNQINFRKRKSEISQLKTRNKNGGQIMVKTHFIPGYTPAHSALVWGRAVATSLKLSPLQRGNLLSLLTAEKLPAGLRHETKAGETRLAMEPDGFAQTLRSQLGLFVSTATVEGMISHLSPEVPTLFPLASNTWVFLPCTQAFQPYLLGAQPDIVKVIPASLWKSLAGICITDPNFVGRMEPSFPVFKNLVSIVFANQPVPFIGTAAEIERIRQIVDLELFGLSAETFKTIIASLPGYTGEAAEQLALEQAFLGIRPGFKPWDNGTTPHLPLSAYLQLLTFEQTANPSIIRTGTNTLQVSDQYGEYPVELGKSQPQPVIAMPRENLPEAPFTGIPDNSVYMVSTGNGMVPGITVCFIIKVNGKSILVETPAYADHYLAELGLKLIDFDYVYVSHHHHDHDSVAQLLPRFQSTHPELIMSPFTAEASRQKSAATIGTSPDMVYAGLKQLPVYPGNPLIIGKGKKKVKLEVINGFHSVLSTMLAVYSSSDSGKTWEKEVVYTGDTLGPRGLAQAVEAGVISQERMDDILNFVKDAKVVVVDAGANIIHSEPDEVITEWQPHVSGVLKIIHNVFEDVQKAKIRKVDLAGLGENQADAWQDLIDKGYIVEVMGTGILTPAFTGKRNEFSLSDTSVKPLEEQIFQVLKQALDTALEAGAKLGLSGEIIPISSLNTSVSILSQVPLLQGLEPTTILKLAQGASVRWAKRGTTLIETGDTSDDRFFVIRKGTVEVLFTDAEGQERKVILGPGQIFGERRVLLGVPANATVRSLSGCELLILTSQQYENLSPKERLMVSFNLTKIEEMRPIIQAAFPRATPEIISYLISAAKETRFDFGDYILTEGDPDVDALYIIADGNIKVWQTIDGQKVLVAERGKGEIIGETGIITGQPRNADCVVDSFMVTALRISAKVIDDLRKLYPGIDLSLKQIAEERRRQASD